MKRSVVILCALLALTLLCGAALAETLGIISPVAYELDGKKYLPGTWRNGQVQLVFEATNPDTDNLTWEFINDVEGLRLDKNAIVNGYGLGFHQCALLGSLGGTEHEIQLSILVKDKNHGYATGALYMRIYDVAQLPEIDFPAAQIGVAYSVQLPPIGLYDPDYMWVDSSIYDAEGNVADIGLGLEMDVDHILRLRGTPDCKPGTYIVRLQVGSDPSVMDETGMSYRLVQKDYVLTVEEKDVTLTFDGNGADGSMDPVTIKANTPYMLPLHQFVTPEGCYFDGWSVNGENIGKTNDIVTFSDDAELRPLWKAKPTVGARIDSVHFGINFLEDGVDGPLYVTVANTGETDLVLGEGYLSLLLDESIESYYTVGRNDVGKTALKPGEECPAFSITPEAGWGEDDWNGKMSLWYDADGTKMGYDFVKLSEADLTLRWVRRTCQITFEPHGGTGAMERVTIDRYSLYKLPECGFAPPEGYAFDGWETGEPEVVLAPGTEFYVSDDITLVAHWRKLPVIYAISFDPNKGTGTMDAGFATEGSDYLVPPCGFTPPENMVFDTWQREDETEVDPWSLIPITGNVKLKALWKWPDPETWRVKFSAHGGTGFMDDILVIKGDKLTLPECAFTAPEGQVFDKWDEGAPGETIEVTEDLTVKALWKDAPADDRLPGDVTGDGKVDIMDVIRLLKKVSEWKVDIVEKNADVTGDGKIDIMDVIRLLKAVSGWKVELK